MFFLKDIVFDVCIFVLSGCLDVYSVNIIFMKCYVCLYDNCRCESVIILFKSFIKCVKTIKISFVKIYSFIMECYVEYFVYLMCLDSML